MLLVWIVTRVCEYATKKKAERALEEMRVFKLYNQCLFPGDYGRRPPDADRLILALGMVRLLPTAAWNLRHRSASCRPMTDTMRAINLEQIEEKRVITISKDSGGLGDQVDPANHIDDWFGVTLADNVQVDGRALRGTGVVDKVFIDWNRFPPQYARDAYPQALDMIARMRENGVLAPNCIVYLPLLVDQGGPRLVYGSRNFTDMWDLQEVPDVTDNPLWCATTLIFTYTQKENAFHLHAQTPFVTFRP